MNRNCVFSADLNCKVQCVVKAPKSEGVVDPKSDERRLVSLLLSGSRGRKSAPKEIPLDAFGGSRRL
ncbi:hypothetical protein TNCV_1468131 [Trichonephila clavipes]|uniref:Uncharacterized protein n=1 Tax=Trichonephila clavipes TaxID=2585209 RepID=A0A8X6VBW5_TRICX|nr:hypothetical protein TNCV_1468131 [Trichonephila clavipes]